jgi:hypothetical protein
MLRADSCLAAVSTNALCGIAQYSPRGSLSKAHTLLNSSHYEDVRGFDTGIRAIASDILILTLCPAIALHQLSEG